MLTIWNEVGLNHSADLERTVTSNNNNNDDDDDGGDKRYLGVNALLYLKYSVKSPVVKSDSTLE